MMRKSARKKSFVLIIVLILVGSIIALITNISNPDVKMDHPPKMGEVTNIPNIAMATNGSDVPDWWVIIFILLVVSIIGDIVTIMVMIVKRKDNSEKAEGTKSRPLTESNKGESDGIGLDSKEALNIKNIKLCPKCGNALKSEYTTCPFCRRELKK